MKTYIPVFVAAVISTATFTNAQDHPFLTKNVVRYPSAKPQNESTFSEMLPVKLISKMNGGVSLSNIKTATQQNLLPEILPAKRIFGKNTTSETSNELPKKPVSKMGFVKRRK